MLMSNEDKVIVFSVALGLLGGVALYFLSAPPIIISIFLAMGVSALVYRFLGGIRSKTTLAVKTITISGTLAALVAVAIIINTYLAQETAADIHDLFQPSVRNWTAIHNEGYAPVSLQIRNIKIKGENPIQADKNIFRGRELKIKLSGGEYPISPREDFDFILGNLHKADIAALNFFNQVVLKRIFFTPRLKAGTQNLAIGNFPFRVSTATYDQGLSEYTLSDSNGIVVHSGNLARWQGESVCLNGTFYLIVVTEADHTASDEGQIFSRFIIIQLEQSII